MTFTREPLQVVELVQPLCSKIFGSTVPVPTTTPSLTKNQGDTIDQALFTRTADVIASFDATFPASPDGVIWEQGATALGLYLGVTSGNLVLRAGFGGAIPNAGAAYCSVSAAAFANRTLRVAVRMTMPGTVNLAVYDGYSVVAEATATAASGFTSGIWAGTDLGGVGVKGGAAIPAGESATTWAGTITNARWWQGTLPVACGATGDKCWNTDETCAFRAALDMTAELPIYFVENLAHDWIYVNQPIAFVLDGLALEAAAALLVQEIGAEAVATPVQPALFIPALVGYKTAPTVLNVAAGSKNMSPLGYRAVAQIKIRDFPWNDIDTDPYLSTRSYVPEDLGSFWSKWLARNPYHVGYTVRIYEGYRGDALAAMTKREYIIEKIDAGRDGASITAKDILRKVTDTGVTAPSLSLGSLAASITDVATTFQAAGAVVADYPASGYVRIGTEVIQYTATALVATNVEFSGLTRGALNTTAAAHAQYDRVQEVAYWVDTPFNEILEDLLVTWAGIDASYITTADWTAEFTMWRATFSFTGYITEPTKVEDLAAEICLQSLSNVWWDERIQKIVLKAQRPDFEPETISDAADILAGSFSIKEKPEERASQVFVYYDMRNPALSVTDKGSYRRAAVFINVDKQIQYGGEPAIRELFCRFIQTDALANNLAATYLARFKDVRREITFELSPDGAAALWTGSTTNISHFLDVDFTGAAKVNNWLIIEAEAVLPGARYRFTAEDNNAAGVLWLWVDEALYSATWSTATADERRVVGYWVDDDGNDAGGNPAPWRWL